MKKITLLIILFVFTFLISSAQTNKELKKEIQNLKEYIRHRIDKTDKLVDDIIWHQRVGDIAHIDKMYIYGPKKWKERNPTSMSAGNPVKFWTYAFFPKNIDTNKKYPLIVLPHGGVHSNFTTYYTHIIRELVSQGYIIVSPEYRGSTGYGKSMYKKIDYGGLEKEDAFYAKNFMLNNYSFIDKNRVGIIGWSHGGMITLHNIFDHPKAYKVAYAGVPVSDIIMRMGYATNSYRKLYEADYHIGQTARENIKEYKRRSPAWNTHKMGNTPLLIHTTTNDADVNVIEVETLIKSLKAEGKKFEYQIFKDLPSGHSLDRTDNKFAREIRVKVYKFLAKYLKPNKPIKSLKELNKAGYRF